MSTNYVNSAVEINLLLKKINYIEPGILNLIKSFFVYKYSKQNFNNLFDYYFYFLKNTKVRKYLKEIKYIFYPNVLLLYEISFENFHNLEIVEFNNHIKQIFPYQFRDCLFLRKVIFPPKTSLIDLGHDSFKNCINLETLDVKLECPVLKTGTFYNCLKLKHVDIGKNLNRIERDCFVNCECLTNIIISSSAYHIEFSSFRNCIIYSLTVPRLVSEYKHSVFINCYVQNIYIDDNLTALVPYFVVIFIICYLLF